MGPKTQPCPAPSHLALPAVTHHIVRMARQARKQGLKTPFDFTVKGAEAQQTCAWPNCPEHGEFRTAKSPRDMSEHIWLCAAHIREHNKAWNYFDGLSDEEVEAMVRNDTVWQRPTWKLGTNTARKATKGFADARFKDHFGLFDDDGDHTPHESHRTFAPNSPEGKAYATLDLSPSATLDEVKARYKKLVKRHHPDANAGAKEAEEKFKEISFAYQVIVKHLQA